jgi:protein-glutamine gamma-glutamyltransferase
VPRTAALSLLAALVIAWSWLRLEHGQLTWSLLLWSIAVGILPALLPSTRLRLAAVPIAALLGLHHAVGTAWPGEAWDRIVDGFYLYYDVPLPFGAAGHPLMHAVIVLAVLGFTLAISLAVAERRALLATGLLVAGAAWPATLLTSSNTVARGAVILGAALVLLGGLSSAARFRQGSIAAAVVVVAAVLVSGVPAVAKGAFLGWETWEPSGKNELPISVGYVWDSDYGALEWPERRTTVLTIEAPPISRYWRATTLDVFNGDYWLESTLEVQPDPLVDPLLPPAGRNENQQFRARVKVEALQDSRLIAASVPVRYQLDDEDAFVLYQSTGTAYVPEGVPRGSTYTSWSYAPRPAPRALARSAPIYSSALDRYLVVQARTSTPPAPRFGAPGRREAMERIFSENPGLNSYRPLYERALAIAGDAPSPYAAVVELETSFRDGQSYVYDQNPTTRGDIPPLVEFVTRTHRGYCQHFAGAMALMLRYLGIPARVGAGFTSGSYDQEEGRWKVTDHDAHTWVEVWFRGYGWLPFDPTPGRGDLDGAYSAASVGFNAAAVSAAIAAGLDAADYKLNTERFDRGGAARSGADGRDLPGDVSGTTSGRSEDSLLRLLALVAAALVAGIGLLKLALRRARFLTRDPRRVAAACRRELEEFLADQKIAVPESATPAELGQFVRQEIALDIGPFVDAVTAARYGPPEQAEEAARRARRELRRIERAIRRRLSRWERARGLVSVRSLGLT